MGNMITSEAMGRPVYASDAQRWAAVVTRDRNADGVFYYSVKTTGVYCRPSCASRPALRRNVDFHASCEDAERAGFRACKRCKPDAPPAAQQYAEGVARACRLLESAAELPDLATLAAAAGMSRFHFHRIFKQVTGMTPKAYAVARRGQRIREELPRRASVTQPSTMPASIPMAAFMQSPPQRWACWLRGFVMEGPANRFASHWANVFSVPFS